MIASLSKFAEEVRKLSEAEFIEIRDAGQVAIGNKVWKDGGREDYLKLIEREKVSKWETQFNGKIDDLVAKVKENDKILQDQGGAKVYDLSAYGLEGVKGTNQIKYLGDLLDQQNALSHLENKLLAGSKSISFSCYRVENKLENLQISGGDWYLKRLHDQWPIDIDTGKRLSHDYCIDFSPITGKKVYE